MRKICLFCAVVVGFLTTAAAQPYPDLGALLDEQKGQKVIEIPKGTYMLDVRRNGAYKFHNLTDVCIHGNGATVLCNNQETALSFYNCVRVHVTDLTIDYDPFCSTQGEIVAVAEDGLSFDVRIDDGYPTENIVPRRVQFYDPATRLLKRNSITTYGSHYADLKQIGYRLFRFVKRGSWSAGERVGDLVTIPVVSSKKGYYGTNTIQLQKCYHMKLERITVYDSSCFSIYEKEGYANEYRNCTIGRGPMPDHLKPRLFAGNADGIHSSQARKGPVMIGNKVGFTGDDCLIVCARSFPIVSVDVKKHQIVLVSRVSHPVLQRGDRLIVVGYDGRRKGELRLQGIEAFTASAEQREAVVSRYPTLLAKNAYNHGYRLQVKNLPFAIEPGDVLFNGDAVGAGFVMRDNEVGNNRSRGILIKGVDGVIERNRIEGCAMHGILVSPEIQWMGGGFSSGISIVDNYINGCMFERSNDSMLPGSLAVVYTTGQGEIPEAGTFVDITIRENRVTNSPAPVAAVASVDGLCLMDNEFVPSTEVERTHGSQYGADVKTPIWEKNNQHK